MGRAAVPLPFGLGQTNESQGRGTMVGQVQATVDSKSGKSLIAVCSEISDTAVHSTSKYRLLSVVQAQSVFRFISLLSRYGLLNGVWASLPT